MQTLLTPGSLHDADGGLAEAGWARRELRRYDRAAVQASRWRIKEWDYYCIANDTAALALTVADNAYLGFLGLSWIDLTGRTATNHGATRAMPLGRMAPSAWKRWPPCTWPRIPSACPAAIRRMNSF